MLIGRSGCSVVLSSLIWFLPRGQEACPCTLAVYTRGGTEGRLVGTNGRWHTGTVTRHAPHCCLRRARSIPSAGVGPGSRRAGPTPAPLLRRQRWPGIDKADWPLHRTLGPLGAGPTSQRIPFFPFSLIEEKNEKVCGLQIFFFENLGCRYVAHTFNTEIWGPRWKIFHLYYCSSFFFGQVYCSSLVFMSSYSDIYTTLWNGLLSSVKRDLRLGAEHLETAPCPDVDFLMSI